MGVFREVFILAGKAAFGLCPGVWTDGRTHKPQGLVSTPAVFFLLSLLLF
jgi:hypothetical protein